jgi:SAM-dependent methyltransferase
MEELPWHDASFDVVTSFNAFQFAAEPTNALREAKRVVKVGGRVAVVVWGRDEAVELTVPMAAIRTLLPPPPPSPVPTLPFNAPGRVEALLMQSQLLPLVSGEVVCAMEFPSLEQAVRGLMSAGPAVAAARQLGTEAVQKALREALEPFKMAKGSYHLQNKLRYVIATNQAGA